MAPASNETKKPAQKAAPAREKKPVPAPKEAMASTASGDEDAERKERRKLIGEVTSDKMHKTVVVRVTHRIRSAQYHKYLTKRVKYKAHDEKNEFKIGDRVEIAESRPLSRDKRWRVTRLIERAKESVQANA
jgi:small subunit ribosomal protein S17